jgi:hypothetical protein
MCLNSNFGKATTVKKNKDFEFCAPKGHEKNYYKEGWIQSLNASLEYSVKNGVLFFSYFHVYDLIKVILVLIMTVSQSGDTEKEKIKMWESDEKVNHN